MSLLSKATDLEKWIQSFVRKKISGSSEQHHLEIRRAVLDEIENKVQPIGNGVRMFPFQLLVISLYAADDDRRYFLESGFIENDRLKNDIRESLRQSGCQRLDRLVVQVKVTDGEAPAWHEKGFDIEYLRQKVDRQRPAAKLIVKTGQAAQPELEISKNNINIGRTRNVEDERGHIVRRNDLVFDETSDGVSNSVSRAHAHIWFDENIGAFRVCDDNSAQGTYIFRDDHLTEVPRNSVNGMKLRPNDEIYLGKAVILFQVANHSATS